MGALIYYGANSAQATLLLQNVTATESNPTISTFSTLGLIFVTVGSPTVTIKYSEFANNFQNMETAYYGAILYAELTSAPVTKPSPISISNSSVN